MSEAQERGVKVILVGVDPPTEQNLSPTLAMEADDVLILDRNFLEPHFRERAEDIAPALEPTDPRDPDDLARAFAAAHVEREGLPLARALLERKPRTIPPEVDRLLLLYAAKSLSVGRVEDDFRRDLRKAFWSALTELAEE